MELGTLGRRKWRSGTRVSRPLPLLRRWGLSWVPSPGVPRDRSPGRGSGGAYSPLPPSPPPAAAPSLARAGWLGARLTARPPESGRQRGQGVPPRTQGPRRRLVRAPRSHVEGDPPGALGPHQEIPPAARWGGGARTWWHGSRARPRDGAHSRLRQVRVSAPTVGGTPRCSEPTHRHRHPCPESEPRPNTQRGT